MFLMKTLHLKGLYQGHPKSGVPVFDSGKETSGKFVMFEHDCSKIIFKIILFTMSYSGFNCFTII